MASLDEDDVNALLATSTTNHNLPVWPLSDSNYTQGMVSDTMSQTTAELRKPIRHRVVVVTTENIDIRGVKYAKRGYTSDTNIKHNPQKT